MANFTKGKIKKRVRGRYSIKSVLPALVRTMSSSLIKAFAHNSSDIKLILESEKLQKRS